MSKQAVKIDEKEEKERRQERIGEGKQKQSDNRVNRTAKNKGQVAERAVDKGGKDSQKERGEEQ